MTKLPLDAHACIQHGNAENVNSAKRRENPETKERVGDVSCLKGILLFLYYCGNVVVMGGLVISVPELKIYLTETTASGGRSRVSHFTYVFVGVVMFGLVNIPVSCLIFGLCKDYRSVAPYTLFMLIFGPFWGFAVLPFFTLVSLVVLPCAVLRSVWRRNCGKEEKDTATGEEYKRRLLDSAFIILLPFYVLLSVVTALFPFGLCSSAWVILLGLALFMLLSILPFFFFLPICEPHRWKIRVVK